MKKMNREGIIIYIIIVILISYLKSIYSLDDQENNNWLYSYFIYFGNNQTVNIIWLIPILTQVLFISKNIYLDLCHFDFRFKNRKNLLKQMFYKLIKLQVIYTLCYIGIHIVCAFVFNQHQFMWQGYMISFVGKYYCETLLFIVLLVSISMVVKQYTITFVVLVMLMIIGINIFPSFYIPIITLFMGEKINALSVIVAIIILFWFNWYYLKLDLLGGIEYDTSN